MRPDEADFGELSEMFLTEFIKRIKTAMEDSSMFKSTETDTENKKKPEIERTAPPAADPSETEDIGERDGAQSKKTDEYLEEGPEADPEREKTELSAAKLAGVVGGGEWDDVPTTDEHDYDPDTIDNV